MVLVWLDWAHPIFAGLAYACIISEWVQRYRMASAEKIEMFGTFFHGVSNPSAGSSRLVHMMVAEFQSQPRGKTTKNKVSSISPLSLHWPKQATHHTQSKMARRGKPACKVPGNRKQEQINHYGNGWMKKLRCMNLREKTENKHCNLVSEHFSGNQRCSPLREKSGLKKTHRSIIGKLEINSSYFPHEKMMSQILCIRISSSNF